MNRWQRRRCWSFGNPGMFSKIAEILIKLLNCQSDMQPANEKLDTYLPDELNNLTIVYFGD